MADSLTSGLKNRLNAFLFEKVILSFFDRYIPFWGFGILLKSTTAML